MLLNKCLNSEKLQSCTDATYCEDGAVINGDRVEAQLSLTSIYVMFNFWLLCHWCSEKYCNCEVMGVSANVDVCTCDVFMNQGNKRGRIEPGNFYFLTFHISTSTFILKYTCTSTGVSFIL